MAAAPKAPLWKAELSESVHMLSPRQAFKCLKPTTIYEAAQHVYVYFVPGQEAVPTVQKVGRAQGIDRERKSLKEGAHATHRGSGRCTATNHANDI